MSGAELSDSRNLSIRTGFLSIAALLLAIGGQCFPSTASAGYNEWHQVAGGGSSPNHASIQSVLSWQAANAPAILGNPCIFQGAVLGGIVPLGNNTYRAYTWTLIDGYYPFDDCVDPNDTWIGWQWDFGNNCADAGETLHSSQEYCDAPESSTSTPNPCALGNPCNPATRGKYQTFVDYEGPGIRFARTWRSRAASEVQFGGFGSETDGKARSS